MVSRIFSIQNAYESIVIAKLHAGSSSLCVGGEQPGEAGFWSEPATLRPRGLAAATAKRASISHSAYLLKEFVNRRCD